MVVGSCIRPVAAGLVGMALFAPIATAWANSPAEALRGQALAHSRSTGLCVLCHALPGVPAHLAGNLGPDLTGIASRLPPSVIRERVLHPDRFNPDTIMPRYGLEAPGTVRVATARVGQPLLTPAQLNDVLAYLDTLK